MCKFRDGDLLTYLLMHDYTVDAKQIRRYSVLATYIILNSVLSFCIIYRTRIHISTRCVVRLLPPRKTPSQKSREPT